MPRSMSSLWWRDSNIIASGNLGTVQRGSNALCFLAAAYDATGQDEKARAAMKAYLDKNPTITLSSYSRIRLYKRAEDRNRLANLLRKAGIPE